MFLLTKPPREKIDRILDAQRDAPFSYPEVGATRGAPPAGYRVDHNRVRLGAGAAVYERAVAALRRWDMFAIGWAELCWPAPIAPGTVVAVVAAFAGLWSINPCRIVYVIDEDDGRARRFGFGYGTLPAHEARGEERFLVEWDRAGDGVWYEILAFSRPRGPLARVGYPAMRLLQRRFAADSKIAMQRASAMIL